MPTGRDRAARRRAEERLATSYGWPERKSERAPMVAVLVVEAVTILAMIFGTAFLLGWRP